MYYVIQVKTGKEQKAIEDILKNKPDDPDFDVFAPFRYDTPRRRSPCRAGAAAAIRTQGRTRDRPCGSASALPASRPSDRRARRPCARRAHVQTPSA